MDLRAKDFVHLTGILHPGERVQVVDARRRWMTGRLTALTPFDLAISIRGQETRVAAAEVLEVRRLERDPLRDGLLKGALVGAALGSTIYLGDGCELVNCAGILLSNAMTFALLGAYIDWRNQKAHVVFSRQPGARLVRHPRADLTLGVGGTYLDLRGGRYPTRDPRFPPEHWGAAVMGAAGWRAAPRVAIEAEVACTCYDRRDTFEQQIVEGPTRYRPVYFEHHYTVVRPSVSVLYYPWPDGRWQPYVGLAAAVDVQNAYDTRVEGGVVEGRLSEVSRESYRKQGVTLTPVELPVDGFNPDTVRTTRSHAFGRVGMKVTVTSRTFLTVEAAVGHRAAPVRAGIGVLLF